MINHTHSFPGSLGKIVAGSNLDEIKSAELKLVDSKGEEAESLILELTVCGGSFITVEEFDFPPGDYKIEIEGEDTSGTPFRYIYNGDISLKSDPNLYELTGDTSAITVDNGKSFKVVYTLKNKGAYCTSFNVEVPAVPSFYIKVLPNGITESPLILKAGESIDITISGTPDSLTPGNRYSIPIIVSNECTSLKRVKPVQVPDKEVQSLIHFSLCLHDIKAITTFFRLHHLPLNLRVLWNVLLQRIQYVMHVPLKVISL